MSTEYFQKVGKSETLSHKNETARRAITVDEIQKDNTDKERWRWGENLANNCIEVLLRNYSAYLTSLASCAQDIAGVVLENWKLM